MIVTSGHPFRTLVEMARAAERDDRQSSGMLYRKLADRIEELEAALREVAELLEDGEPVKDAIETARAALNSENKP